LLSLFLFAIVVAHPSFVGSGCTGLRFAPVLLNAQD
jgi:hypothetical protein